MKNKFIRWLIIFFAAMLVNDVIQTILAYRKYRKEYYGSAVWQ